MERANLKEGWPLGEWWKNHILSQVGEEMANVAYFGDSLKLCEAMSFEKWHLQRRGNDIKGHEIVKLWLFAKQEH